MSQLNLTYKGKTYNLEYTRRSVRTMESQGFDLNDIGTKPVTTLPALFRGAFLAHHKSLKADLVDEMFDHLKGKDELISVLASMYAEPFTALLDEPTEDEENATWAKV